MKSWNTVLPLSIALGTAVAIGPVHAADYKVGLTATYSGDFAAYGQSLRNGAELAFKTKAQQGLNISLDIVDDRGSPQEGVLVAQRLCSDPSVVAVLGYTFSSVALAAVPILDECSLPVIASAVTSPDLSGASAYFRRNVMTDAEQGRRMGSFAAKTLEARNIYVLYQQDDYGYGVSDAFSTAAEAGGATISGSEAYHLGENNFRTLLTKVKAEAPDTVFIGGFYAEAAKILEQAKQMGLNVQFLGTDGSLNPQLVALSKGAAEGMVVYGMFDPSIESDVSAGFVSAYRAAYKADPDVWAALGYDAASVVIATIAEQKKIAEVDREGLNAALSLVKDYPGVTGTIQFNDKGDREGQLFFFRVQNGIFEPVRTK
ncbi:ABC transporter substrate-binding protein [Ensifer adhaerens]|uniref:ABC transporter substrate-binding protein n=1 Tax=Ensifer adhaerens TaxID=106592 RepID=UPI0014480589|nr:ABC transporter substrate-binding protein [Ensifer adhaerens]MDF8357556.1 ABC transporter substrate-binding protein [Ensifer adhaerens]